MPFTKRFYLLNTLPSPFQQNTFSNQTVTQNLHIFVQEITCPECGKLYWAGQWLRFRRHLATHEQRFCELCGVSCKNAQALRAHRYRHNKKQRTQHGPGRPSSEGASQNKSFRLNYTHRSANKIKATLLLTTARKAHMLVNQGNRCFYFVIVAFLIYIYYYM